MSDTRAGAAGASAPFELTPPAPVAPVAPAGASGHIPLSPADIADLDAQVRTLVDTVAHLEPEDPRVKECAERIHAMGSRDIEQAARLSSRFLERPLRTMSQGVLDTASPVSKALLDLRTTIEKLDPSRHDLLSPRKLLGLIPFGSRIHAYFEQYRSAQSHLNAIVESLRRGKDELLRDNAAIEQEKVHLWALMERMEKYIHLGRQLDAALEAQAAQLEMTDARRARFLREELLFQTRQKVTDLLTQTAVNVQGYMALDLVRRNNLELIKGVDRATTTTMAALRTAVMVAQALTNQKLVLEQISALNATTGQVIEATSALLAGQTARIHQQAASSTIGIDTLHKAFQNIYQVMDAITEFRSKSLDSLRQTVDALSGEVARARTCLEQTQDAPAPASTEQVQL